MNQLDLFAHTPEPVENPLPPPRTKPPPALEWWQARAAFYLRTMNQTMQSHLPPAAKRAQITRLHKLRNEALARCDALTKGHTQA